MVAEKEKPIHINTPFPRKVHEEIDKYRSRVRFDEDRKITLTQAVVELVERGLRSIENN